jgi:hypothetical protein
MKRAVILLGTISIIILLVAVTFKSLNYPGADFLLTYGALYNCLTSITVIIILFRSDETSKGLYYYGAISFFCFNACLYLYKINFGALPLTIGSAVLIIFVVFLAIKLLNRY